MTLPVSPETTVAVDEGAKLLSDLIKALDAPGTTVAQVSTVVVEALGIAAVAVGAFDHSLGLAISAVPQATIAASGALLLAVLNVVRLLGKTKTKVVAAQIVAARLTVPVVVPVVEPLPFRTA